MAILGPEIARRRRITGGTPIGHPADATSDPSAFGDSHRPVGVAIDVTGAEEMSAERRQNERRYITSNHVTGPDRRAADDRRDSADRRATLLERQRRLTPAGRHALNLIAGAAENPVPLTGDGGLLTGLVTHILQRGLEVEIAAHLGHGRWESGSRGAQNIRNGAYPKRVLTDLGAIQVQMPRDRRGSFEPVIVPKHGRRLATPTGSVAAVYASGLTRAEIRSQLDNLTRARLSRNIVDSLTDDLEPDIRAWQRRRFESAYPVLLIDSITLSAPGARPTGRSLDVAVAIDAYGDHELLGCWRRPSRAVQSGARWSGMLDELHYRGISALEFVCCPDQAGLSAAVTSVFPLAKVRSGVDALIQNSLRCDA